MKTHVKHSKRKICAALLTAFLAGRSACGDFAYSALPDSVVTSRVTDKRIPADGDFAPAVASRYTAAASNDYGDADRVPARHASVSEKKDFRVGCVGTREASSEEIPERTALLFETIRNEHCLDKEGNLLPMASARSKFDAHVAEEQLKYNRALDAHNAKYATQRAQIAEIEKTIEQERTKFEEDMKGRAKELGVLFFGRRKILQRIGANMYLCFAKDERVFAVRTLQANQYVDDDYIHDMFVRWGGTYSYTTVKDVPKTVRVVTESAFTIPVFLPSVSIPESLRYPAYPPFDTPRFNSFYTELTDAKIEELLKNGFSFFVKEPNAPLKCRICDGRGYTRPSANELGKVLNVPCHNKECRNGVVRRSVTWRVYWTQYILLSRRTPVKTPSGASVQTGKPAENTVSAASTSAQNILEKIVFPSVNFSETKLSEVLSSLAKLSAENNPDGGGVEIIFDPSVNEARQNAPFSCALSNIPLKKLLDHIAREQKMEFVFRRGKVVFFVRPE